jgi:hypothetical protein
VSLRTSWERQDDRITHYIRITHWQVIVGSHAGSGHTDNASACGYDEFVDGRFHTHILAHFDEGVLTAVLAAVQAAQTYPPFIAKRDKTAVAHAFLESIPIDPTLADFPRHPDTENGATNYGNGGGYKTILRSDTVTLTVERNEGFVMPNEGSEKQALRHSSVQAFTLPGHASSTVALHDHFYLVVSDAYAIVTPDGAVLTQERPIFGTFLRINAVYRLEDTVCFGYFWLRGEHPRGWLRYVLGVGFNGRCLK